MTRNLRFDTKDRKYVLHDRIRCVVHPVAQRSALPLNLPSGMDRRVEDLGGFSGFFRRTRHHLKNSQACSPSEKSARQEFTLKFFRQGFACRSQNQSRSFRPNRSQQWQRALAIVFRLFAQQPTQSLLNHQVVIRE